MDWQKLTRQQIVHKHVIEKNLTYRHLLEINGTTVTACDTVTV